MRIKTNWAYMRARAREDSPNDAAAIANCYGRFRLVDSRRRRRMPALLLLRIVLEEFPLFSADRRPTASDASLLGELTLDKFAVSHTVGESLRFGVRMAGRSPAVGRWSLDLIGWQWHGTMDGGIPSSSVPPPIPKRGGRESNIGYE